jgi:hypothetical protein
MGCFNNCSPEAAANGELRFVPYRLRIVIKPQPLGTALENRSALRAYCALVILTYFVSCHTVP